VQLVDIHDPHDPAVAGVARLLLDVFADPNTVLGKDRLCEFLADRADRLFNVLILGPREAPLGATVFSYVPRSNCGFSEYLVLREHARGHGLGRRLSDARKARLDAAAQSAGFAACNGLFIEADNPDRTPTGLLEAERQTAIDEHERLRIFAHLGFFRVDIPYVQPPLGPGKQPVHYLDLLFAPFSSRMNDVPAAWVVDTLAPVWRAWAGEDVALPRVDSDRLRLLPLQLSA
jgi:GNAT superfamily N-acetyltransferase